jgi:hypothetical protein
MVMLTAESAVICLTMNTSQFLPCLIHAPAILLILVVMVRVVYASVRASICHVQ